MGLLEILQLIETLVPQLLSFGTQAVQAWQTGDQAALDAIKAKADAVADALKPTE
jgi:hypothetical protein